jgi:hypothetical protein
VAAWFLAFVLLSVGTIVFAGLAITAEYRWVRRSEYLIRLEYRTWDQYWPIEIPFDLSDPLY